MIKRFLCVPALLLGMIVGGCSDDDVGKRYEPAPVPPKTTINELTTEDFSKMFFEYGVWELIYQYDEGGENHKEKFLFGLGGTGVSLWLAEMNTVFYYGRAGLVEYGTAENIWNRDNRHDKKWAERYKHIIVTAHYYPRIFSGPTKTEYSKTEGFLAEYYYGGEDILYDFDTWSTEKKLEYTLLSGETVTEDLVYIKDVKIKYVDVNKTNTVNIYTVPMYKSIGHESESTDLRLEGVGIIAMDGRAVLPFYNLELDIPEESKSMRTNERTTIAKIFICKHPYAYWDASKQQEVGEQQEVFAHPDYDELIAGAE